MDHDFDYMVSLKATIHWCMVNLVSYCICEFIKRYSKQSYSECESASETGRTTGNGATEVLRLDLFNALPFAPDSFWSQFSLDTLSFFFHLFLSFVSKISYLSHVSTSPLPSLQRPGTHFDLGQRPPAITIVSLSKLIQVAIRRGRLARVWSGTWPRRTGHLCSWSCCWDSMDGCRRLRNSNCERWAVSHRWHNRRVVIQVRPFLIRIWFTLRKMLIDTNAGMGGEEGGRAKEKTRM